MFSLPPMVAAGIILTALAAIVVRGMIAVAIMDLPDHRKPHPCPTPTAGGLGVLAACLLGPALLPALRVQPAPWLLAVAGMLGVVALADDMRARPVALKLAAQLAAAVVAVGLGLRLGPGVAEATLTIAWIIVVTNAFNFIDGSDGLAPGVALLACVAVIALAPGSDMAMCLALGLAAGLAGFLPFNFPRAKIFLGDTGSQPIGFLLACLGLLLPAGDGVWLMPMLLAGVLFDVVVTLARRLRAGARLTEAHREHLYQQASLPAPAIAIVHWGFVLWGANCWFALSAGATPMVVAVLLVAPQFIWMGFVLRGHEVSRRKSRLRHGCR